jgi:hypothetical protein
MENARTHRILPNSSLITVAEAKPIRFARILALSEDKESAAKSLDVLIGGVIR